MEYTNRGFAIKYFNDRNDRECCIQKSSIATEDCIWLGLLEPEIKEFFPYPRNTDESWFDVSNERLQSLKQRPQNEIHAFSRMELTQE